jgi:peptidoglycan-N-acetylglucosamine deacetylase
MRAGTTLLVGLALLVPGGFVSVAARTVGPLAPRSALAAVSTAANVGPRIEQRIRRCYDTSPRVWLTFDDGGSVRQVELILTQLRVHRVKAIFFPTGMWAAAHASLVRRMVRQGHLLGNHTYDHPDLMTLSDHRVHWEIRHGVTSTAEFGPLLRPPYGDGAYTTRLHRLASGQGQRLCSWTVDTRDWTGASAATIVRRVQIGDALTPPVRAGGVVLMHMQGRHTGEALSRVIGAVRQRGLLLHRLPALTPSPRATPSPSPTPAATPTTSPTPSVTATPPPTSPAPSPSV